MKTFLDYITEEPEDDQYDDYDQDAGEYDYEGAMALVQLRTIIRNAETMLTLLQDDTNLPEWIQSKLTIAEDHMMTSANYIQSRMEG
jgi:hypothetical protein|tara:strand:- start:171 stop:431 length:261 start_codon:yes stop_codon:yes gene_type:complete